MTDRVRLQCLAAPRLAGGPVHHAPRLASWEAGPRFASWDASMSSRGGEVKMDDIKGLEEFGGENDTKFLEALCTLRTRNYAGGAAQ